MLRDIYGFLIHLRRRNWFQALLFVLLVTLLIEFAIASVSANQVQSTAIDRDFALRSTYDQLADSFVANTLHNTFGLNIDYDSGLDYDDRSVRINTGLINNSRWPRVVMAALVGAGLALAGNVLQGVFRNPLADPGLIGVSSGAAMGAIIAILGGADLAPLIDTLIDTFQLSGTIVEDVSGRRLAEASFAFVGGLLMTFVVYYLAQAGGRQAVTTNMLLIGLAINAIGAAFIGLATFVGNERRTSDITFWSLGSLKDLEWAEVYITLPIMLVGMIVLPFMGRQLNIMTLGETEARNLGVNTDRVRQICVALSALMIGVAVGFAGIIGFIGLVVPHVMRLLFGPDHRRTLPGSMLGGAIVLIAADLYGRTLPPPPDSGVSLEVPVGVLTALIGGPFFLALILTMQLRRARL